MTEEKILKTAHEAQPALIQDIYAAASNPDEWQQLIDRLVRIFDARSARLLWLDQSATKVRTSYMVNTDAGYQQSYSNYYVNLCPWRPEIRSKPPGQLYSSYFDFSQSQEDFHHSEFYQDWARPQEIEHGIGGTVYQNESTTVQLLLQRTREAGCFTPQEKAFLNSLAPFLQQAFVLQQQIETIAAQNQIIGDASTRSPMPFMLLDKDGKMAYACDSIQSMLRTRDCLLELRHGRPRLRNVTLDGSLSSLIRKTLQSACGQWHSGGGRLQLPEQQQRKVSLYVAPLTWEGPLTSLTPTRCFAIVYLHDRQAATILDKTRLILDYQLTQAEAGVTELMAQGLPLPEIAKRLNSSIHTVRNQAKSIYAKTDTKGQTQLLRLLLTGSIYQPQ
ncbi:MAG TPA: LuxR family transcriptional regulator [Gammaproteobacteria bacterium]|nr:LuxR family transcriptional regulator [Gammaproteobacteria bacterium]